MIGIDGYIIKDVRNMVVLSPENAKLERKKLLSADKSRGSYFKPFVNPESYTDEEKRFMEAG